jgi:hypothetical protein
MLRSLEQKSPLNIYVIEADKNFEIMKDNVANGCILAICKFFIAEINKKIFEVLKAKINEKYLLDYASTVQQQHIRPAAGHMKIVVDGNTENSDKIDLDAMIMQQVTKDSKNIAKAKEFEQTKLDNAREIEIKETTSIINGEEIQNAKYENNSDETQETDKKEEK